MASFADALEFVKKLDLKKVQSGIESVGSGLEIAGAAIRNPEVALAGLLRVFARGTLGEELSDAGASDLAKVFIGQIKKQIKKQQRAKK